MGKPVRARKPSAKVAAQESNKQDGTAREKATFEGHKTSRGTSKAVLVRVAKAGGKLVVRVGMTAGAAAGELDDAHGPRCADST
jgi:hypothetical protein